MENIDDTNSNSHLFDKCIWVFIEHIESLANSLPTILTTIEATHKKALRVHQKFLENDCDRREEDGKVYFLVKPEHSRRNKKLRKDVNQSGIAHQIIQRNFIVSLVSQFDSFLGSLIRVMFVVCPEILNQSEKQLTFSELVKFKDIDSAREFIIEKEIETVLRGSHTDHFLWFENKLKTTLRKDLDSWSTFIELTERRNLFVHNNGTVSNQYINICKQNGVEFNSEINIGDKLLVEPDYFDQAFKCIFEIGIKLSQVIRRKLLPSEILEADRSILNISFELIQSNQYELAKELLDFCEKYIKKYSSDDFKFRILLNRAQVYKWIGDSATCERIILDRDWSACNNVFKLASQVLLDDFENAIRTMKLIGADNEEIDKTKYKEWPIFKEFRREESFKQCFFEIFKEPFEAKEAIAESGFRLIDEKSFIEILDDCLDIADSKPNGFVGSKFFVETKLANKGYDIGSCWALYQKLIENDIIESYIHIDENGKFPPLNSIRRKKLQPPNHL